MIAASRWSLKTPSSFLRFLFFLVLSGVLMVSDHRGHHLQKIRAALAQFLYPVEVVASLPGQSVAWLSDYVTTTETQRQELGQLRAQRIELLAKLQQYDLLAAENDRLRDLLGASKRMGNRTTTAPLIQVSAEPFTRQLLLGKGASAGVHVGQAAIDAYGLMGQISEVDASTSRLTLITDSSSSVPVEVVRNGLRTIVVGTGVRDQVEAPYLTASADIQVGDLLVTSGLGGVFPAGYPVARVIRIINDPNEAFLKIIARPAAHLEHGDQVLLIWPDEHAAAADKKR